MEKDKAKVVEIVGTASERAGNLVGTAAALGKRIAGVAAGGVSAGKGMPGLAGEDTKGVPEKKSNSTKAVGSKSDLASVRRQLVKKEKEKSQLESQLETLQKKNNSLISELEQAVSEAKEITAGEGVVRARAAALESELNAARQQLEQTNNKADNTKGKKPPARTGSKAKLEADLAATRRQKQEIQDETKKAQSQFESKLEDMQAEKDSLLSELEAVRKDAKAERINNQVNALLEQLSALESELAATRQELTEARSQAESAQAELRQQLEKLQLENDSLKSDFQITQSRADEAKAREDAMKTKAAALESEVTGLRSELAEAEISNSDNNAIGADEQTDFSESEEEVKETSTAPAGTEEFESSMESAAGPKDNEMNERTEEQPAETVVAAKQISKLPLQAISSPQTEKFRDSQETVGSPEFLTAQGEAIDVNVEERELKSEARSQPEAATAHSAEVTAEEGRAADFKNGAERILFLKALSDFGSRDAITRADAAAAIGGIHHELSPRLIITHIADEPSAYVRQECIKALTALGSKEGLGVIEQSLSDESASVRLAAVWGLYRLAGTESIPALTRMLSDKDTSVRRRAVTCIGWLGGQISRADNHHFHQVISALIHCLKEPAVNTAALDTLQIVTGKKMSSPRTSPERLIAQWQKWWKAELLG
ncbi:MAG TPA: hypothetical protein HPP66_06430 [Planctomycetes bacterium]|nr:hypothetical protein [Planctomycetota bacterium]